ncbi:MAG TPA: class I SAM-dependent methyltransferase [Ohtaekwangia sp.]|nr:class I SAM-dependent methyltransferase [Ohtaekwangia sp.]
MKDITICPACDGKEFIEFISTIDFTHTGERFTLLQCATCQLLATTPQPDEIEILKYYESSDYISHTDKPANVVDALYKIARHFTLKSKINLVKKYSPKIENILDFGCGTGDFLLACKNQGWDVTGIEPSANARSIAAKKIGKPSIHPSLPSEQTDYQAITLWHVLEHVHDLSQLLTKLKDSLAREGALYLAVPNTNAWESTIYKEHWAAYDVPRHLWHFNQDAMRRLLSKHNFALTHIIPMKLDAFYVSLLSEKYKRNGTTISGMINAFKNGLISNQRAKRTSEYSSLIYVFKHA